MDEKPEAKNKLKMKQKKAKNKINSDLLPVIIKPNRIICRQMHNKYKTNGQPNGILPLNNFPGQTDRGQTEPMPHKAKSVRQFSLVKRKIENRHGVFVSPTAANTNSIFAYPFGQYMLFSIHIRLPMKSQCIVNLNE